MMDYFCENHMATEGIQRVDIWGESSPFVCLSCATFGLNLTHSNTNVAILEHDTILMSLKVEL